MDIRSHRMTATDARLFENLADCDAVMINHVVIPAGDGFDAHHTDSNVFILVRRGAITLTFADGERRRHAEGELVEIPYRIFMKIDNLDDVPLELVVIKAPNPKTLAQG